MRRRDGRVGVRSSQGKEEWESQEQDVWWQRHEHHRTYTHVVDHDKNRFSVVLCGADICVSNGIPVDGFSCVIYCYIEIVWSADISPSGYTQTNTTVLVDSGRSTRDPGKRLQGFVLSLARRVIGHPSDSKHKRAIVAILYPWTRQAIPCITLRRNSTQCQ